MWNAWTKLCQANLDHYNEHPGRHYAIMAGYSVVAVVVCRKAFQKIVLEAPNAPSGQYANL